MCRQLAAAMVRVAVAVTDAEQGLVDGLSELIEDEVEGEAAATKATAATAATAVTAVTATAKAALPPVSAHMSPTSLVVTPAVEPAAPTSPASPGSPAGGASEPEVPVGLQESEAPPAKRPRR
jgi:hypothetical protein